jgi:pimeloyl-ACP methyl ester carboxylesterase
MPKLHRGQELRGRHSECEAPLVLHGEDDQIVPVKDSAVKSARLIKGAKDIYYPGAPHGITATHQDQVNAELLAFLRGSPETSRRGDRMMAAASTTR